MPNLFSCYFPNSSSSSAFSPSSFILVIFYSSPSLIYPFCYHLLFTLSATISYLPSLPPSLIYPFCHHLLFTLSATISYLPSLLPSPHQRMSMIFSLSSSYTHTDLQLGSRNCHHIRWSYPANRTCGQDATLISTHVSLVVFSFFSNE